MTDQNRPAKIAKPGGTPRSSSVRRADSDASKRALGMVRLSLWMSENDVKTLHWLTLQHEVTCRHEMAAAAIRHLAKLTEEGARVTWRKGCSPERSTDAVPPFS